jgi:glyoxylase-like metal-dependent hydrolase (beta-lactamase superfamily II)
MAVEGHIHRQKFDRVSRAPVRAVVVTQAHVDHVGGLGAFKGPDTEIIAHVNNSACQADDARIKGFRALRSPRFFPPSFYQIERSEADRAAMQKGIASAQVKVEPTRLVSDRYAFTLGGVRFEVIALPAG